MFFQKIFFRDEKNFGRRPKNIFRDQKKFEKNPMKKSMKNENFKILIFRFFSQNFEILFVIDFFIQNF